MVAGLIWSGEVGVGSAVEAGKTFGSAFALDAAPIPGCWNGAAAGAAAGAAGCPPAGPGRATPNRAGSWANAVGAARRLVSVSPSAAIGGCMGDNPRPGGFWTPRARPAGGR